MADHSASTEPDPVSARRRETQSRLLDAAAEVFAEYGLQGASVERICTRADFTRGAFYSNFSSKEELFITLLSREYEHRAEHITARAAELTNYLTQRSTPVTPAETSAYVADFLAPNGDEAAWFALETELLLLALREPDGPFKYIEFSTVFHDELRRVVEGIIHAAGRRFTISADHAMSVLGGVYDRALRATALGGPDAAGGLHELGGRISELLFAITDASES